MTRLQQIGRHARAHCAQPDECRLDHGSTPLPATAQGAQASLTDALSRQFAGSRKHEARNEKAPGRTRCS